MNNIVRVEKNNDIQFGPLLELHKFIGTLSSTTLIRLTTGYALGTLNESRAECQAAPHSPVPLVGVGPFVTLRVGGSEVVQSFGIGLMIGFRKAENDKSLNLGVAFSVDPSVRTLGDGLDEGKALPQGESAIRYKTTHQEGLMVLFSIGW